MTTTLYDAGRIEIMEAEANRSGSSAVMASRVDDAYRITDKGRAGVGLFAIVDEDKEFMV